MVDVLLIAAIVGGRPLAPLPLLREKGLFLPRLRPAGCSLRSPATEAPELTYQDVEKLSFTHLTGRRGAFHHPAGAGALRRSPTRQAAHFVRGERPMAVALLSVYSLGMAGGQLRAGPL